MNTLNLILASLGCLVASLGPAHAAAPSRPSILVILADHLGYGDVGCYNPQSKVASPHWDRLAGEGMIHSDAQSHATVCTPARCSLMTGQVAFCLPDGSGCSPASANRRSARSGGLRSDSVAGK